jgi:hypothetical protein
MAALKLSAWEFITKAIEYLDAELGVGYVTTPMPLLWRIVRESLFCSGAAQKLMISRLLQVFIVFILIPSVTYLHQHTRSS